VRLDEPFLAECHADISGRARRESGLTCYVCVELRRCSRGATCSCVSGTSSAASGCSDGANSRRSPKYSANSSTNSGPRSYRWPGSAADDYLPRLEARVAQGELRSSTATQYKRDIRNHLLPEFGPYRLDQIDVEQVERFRDKLTRRGLSNGSIKRVITTLGYTLKLARKWRLIQYNPVADADKPRARRRTPTLPTVDGIERLAQAMPTRETTALVLFAAFTGARKSECFALRWNDVDLTRGKETARIVRQFYKGELVDETKTPAGETGCSSERLTRTEANAECCHCCHSSDRHKGCCNPPRAGS
jgi:hypothetical protein